MRHFYLLLLSLCYSFSFIQVKAQNQVKFKGETFNVWPTKGIRFNIQNFDKPRNFNAPSGYRALYTSVATSTSYNVNEDPMHDYDFNLINSFNKQEDGKYALIDKKKGKKIIATFGLVENQFNGLATFYHKSGRPMTWGEYKMGLKDGKWNYEYKGFKEIREYASGVLLERFIYHKKSDQLMYHARFDDQQVLQYSKEFSPEGICYKHFEFNVNREPVVKTYNAEGGLYSEAIGEEYFANVKWYYPDGTLKARIDRAEIKDSNFYDLNDLDMFFDDEIPYLPNIKVDEDMSFNFQFFNENGLLSHSFDLLKSSIDYDEILISNITFNPIDEKAQTSLSFKEDGEDYYLEVRDSTDRYTRKEVYKNGRTEMYERSNWLYGEYDYRDLTMDARYSSDKEYVQISKSRSRTSYLVYFNEDSIRVSKKFYYNKDGDRIRTTVKTSDSSWIDLEVDNVKMTVSDGIPVYLEVNKQPYTGQLDIKYKDKGYSFLKYKKKEQLIVGSVQYIRPYKYLQLERANFVNGKIQGNCVIKGRYSPPQELLMKNYKLNGHYDSHAKVSLRKSRTSKKKYVDHDKEKTATLTNRYNNEKVRDVLESGGKYHYYKYQSLDFANGAINGDVITFDIDGTVRARQQYDDGWLNGECVDYNGDGVAFSRSVYKNNAKIFEESLNKESGYRYSYKCENDTCVKARYLNDLLMNRDTSVNGRTIGTSYLYSILYNRVTTKNYDDKRKIFEPTRGYEIRKFSQPVPKLEIMIDDHYYFKGWASKNKDLFADSNEIFYDNGQLAVSFFADSTNKIVAIKEYHRDGKLKSYGNEVTATKLAFCESKEFDFLFDYNPVNYIDHNGRQMVSNGSGYLIYTIEGTPMYEGELINGRREGLWKEYDLNGNINGIGHYKNDQRTGIWYFGDLQDINFITGCMNESDPDYEKNKEKLQNELKVSAYKYIDGKEILLYKQQNYQYRYNRRGPYYSRVPSF